MTMAVEHDLTPDELDWLYQRVSKRKASSIRYRWVWNADGPDGSRIIGPWLEVAGGDIAGVGSDSDVSPSVIVRSILNAQQREHASRSAAAKQAAKTRAKRRELELYRVVAELRENKALPARQHCRLCGKGLTDKESISRGIGSDCWQSVMGTLQAKAARGRV